VIGESRGSMVGAGAVLSLLIHHPVLPSRFHPGEEAQEGRLFGPAGLHQDLCHGGCRRTLGHTWYRWLMGLLDFAGYPQRTQNPLNRWLIGCIPAVLGWCWLGLKVTLALAL